MKMPRSRRIVVPGFPHHITQRGNHRMDVFIEKEDRHVFLRILDETSRLYSLGHQAYSLMTNHIHLISTPKETHSLSHSMRDLLGSYASYFNRKYGLAGRFWQGRFYSAVLDETHFLAAMRYVERNAVQAGMVKRAEEYEWSSAACHCGIRTDFHLTPLPATAGIIHNWSQWLAEEGDKEQIKRIRSNTKTGYPCGSSMFVKELEIILGRPIRRRKVGRPKRVSEGMEEQMPKKGYF